MPLSSQTFGVVPLTLMLLASFATGCQKAAPLKGLADAINVTDGAGARAHMSPVAAAAILLREGIEPILQLTCRDRNRIALQSELMGAAALGIRNLLLQDGIKTAQVAHDTKPNTVGVHSTHLALQCSGEQTHEQRHFLRGATPVLRAKGEQREVGHTAGNASLDDTAHCLDSLGMTRNTRQVARGRPAAIPVHDDGNMGRDQRSLGYVLRGAGWGLGRRGLATKAHSPLAGFSTRWGV